MPHHVKIKKLAFYRLMKRHLSGEMHIRILKPSSFDGDVYPKRGSLMRLMVREYAA